MDVLEDALGVRHDEVQDVGAAGRAAEVDRLDDVVDGRRACRRGRSRSVTSAVASGCGVSRVTAATVTPAPVSCEKSRPAWTPVNVTVKGSATRASP